MKDAVDWSEVFKNVAAEIASLLTAGAAIEEASKKKDEK